MMHTIAKRTIVLCIITHFFSWSMLPTKYQEISSKTMQLADQIGKNNDLLRAILSDYQTHHTTDYEIERSIRTLKGIDHNMDYLASDKTIGSTAVVLPSNLPLYSLVIFGLIPSFMSQEVSIRPNTLLQEKNIVPRIAEVLNLNSTFSNVKIVNVKEHSEFKPYFTQADLIIFTGNPTHAEKLSETMKQGSVLVVNGSGHNPVIVAENADINEAVKKTVDLKSFNGGQDCAGPDAILVHASTSEEFIEKFTKGFSSVKTGQFTHPKTMIGTIERESEMRRLTKILYDNGDTITSGGTYNFKTKILDPTIIVRSIENNPNYTEMFGPIAFIHPYKNDNDLKLYFNDTKGAYQSHRMYTTLFGNSTYIETRDDNENPGKKGNVGIVLKNKTIHDVEIGYEPYGGYSFGASYVLKKTAQGKIQKKAMPILIPQVIAEYLLENKNIA